MLNLQPIFDFLMCATPQSWLEAALANPEMMLIDHAHCEKKAASTALSLMYRYSDKLDLILQMSRIAREELRHFEQVLSLIQKRDIEYCAIKPSRYAEAMRKEVRTYEPEHLIDILIIGGIIEARSCERFYRLLPHLDTELSLFYERLLASEARHFQTYLEFAHRYAKGPIDERIQELLQCEQALILSEDEQFRFHSGVPMSTVV